MGQVSKLFPCREYFAPELDAGGPKSFSPGFFNHFAHCTAENFGSVFLTGVRPEPGIVILRCDQMGEISKFSPRESILLQNLTPVVPKVSLQDFLIILAVDSVFLTGVRVNGTFDRYTTKIYVWSF